VTDIHNKQIFYRILEADSRDEYYSTEGIYAESLHIFTKKFNVMEVSDDTL
jgi:hypothetical protein